MKAAILNGMTTWEIRYGGWGASTALPSTPLVFFNLIQDGSNPRSYLVFFTCGFKIDDSEKKYGE